MSTDAVPRWAVSVATAAALALGSWNFSTTASTATRVSVQEERVMNMKEQLDRIERKLDKLGR